VLYICGAGGASSPFWGKSPVPADRMTLSAYFITNNLPLFNKITSESSGIARLFYALTPRMPLVHHKK